MNTNFQVRRVTGYDPGYPVGRRRPGRLEARPLKFLFLVVGFLFFFVGFGCDNIKGDATDTQNKPDTTVTPDPDVAESVPPPSALSITRSAVPLSGPNVWLPKSSPVSMPGCTTSAAGSARATDAMPPSRSTGCSTVCAPAVSLTVNVPVGPL